MKKIIAFFLLTMFIFSMGCTTTNIAESEDDSQDGGTTISEEDLAPADEIIDDLSSEIEDLNILIEDSDINIEDIIIDEELI
jgi:peptidoglycan hydrolase CwlO-like protein